MDISQILATKFDGKKWALSGNDYSGFEWFEDTPKPTEDELLSLWDEVQTETFNKNAERQRRIAYRDEVDPIFFQWQRGEATEQDWRDAIVRVRERFPYADGTK